MQAPRHGSAYDAVVVGAGIVGLAVARALRARLPRLRVAVIDKEPAPGLHQTTHNSGVIHSGIYYPPGSLKASLCRRGGALLVDFCDAWGIRYELCGKVVVATDETQLPALGELHRRAVANQVPGVRMISRAELRELEPRVSGIAALVSPSAGIVSFPAVARALAAELRSQGVDLLLNHGLRATLQKSGGAVLETTAAALEARYVVNCAGLYADRVARILGVAPEIQIVPFRGEYFDLEPHRRDVVNNLVYPVPDPELPFLGVHLTRTLDGRVEAGPSAVLAWAREGYRRRDLRPRDLVETLRYPGFRSLTGTHWRAALHEYKTSFSKRAFARQLQTLVPEISARDLTRAGTGVRAQAVAPDGALLDDFCIARGPSSLHVLNAPSPAATASLAIGEHIAGLVESAFDTDSPGSHRGRTTRS